MREKIKIGVFVVSIFYSVMIVILSLTSYVTSVSEIQLYDSEENIVKLKQYEKELYSLPQNSCTTAIYDVIRYYKETSYNGYVNIKDFYNNYNDNFPSIYEKCNISDSEKEYYVNYLRMFGIMFYNKSFEKFNNQYIIGYKDWIIDSGVELTDYEYVLIKNTELKIIEELLENVKRGDFK